MVFDKIAATVGGLCKDIQVAVTDTAEWIVDEVSSIPEAFSAGYDHGIMSAPDDTEEHDHHVTVVEEETLAEKHGSRFSQRAA